MSPKFPNNNFPGEKVIMNNVIKAFCLAVILCVPVAAQTSGSSDDYNKNEFYVGYSNQQVDNGNRSSFNGFEGSFTRNVSKWVGIRGTISGAYNRRTLSGNSLDPATGNFGFEVDNNRSVYNFLGGVQIKNNASQKKIKPFAFALGGVAVSRTEYKNLRCSSQVCPAVVPPFFFTGSFSTTKLAGAFGGGIDVRINDRFDFRAIQVDYNPVQRNGGVNHNFRIGAGIVIK